MLYLSKVIGRPVSDGQGAPIGKVDDLIVAVGGRYPPVTGLVVSARTCENDKQQRHYAAVVPGGDGILLVSDDTIARFEIDLAEFETP